MSAYRRQLYYLLFTETSSGSRSSPTTPRHFHVVFVDNSIITLFEKLCASEMKAFDEERYTSGKRGSPAIELKESFAQIIVRPAKHSTPILILGEKEKTVPWRNRCFFCKKQPRTMVFVALYILMSIIAPSALVIRHQTYDLARSFSDSDIPSLTALQTHRLANSQTQVALQRR